MSDVLVRDVGPRSWAPPAGRSFGLLCTALIAAAVLAVVGGDEAVYRSVSVVPWVSLSAVLILLVLGSSHFLFAAWGLRAASGQPLPLRPTMSAQLAAAATNRIVPNGIGGTALNLRYLRRAGISTGAAASVLVALAVVAGLTDLGFVGTVTTVGPHLGLTGAAQEMTALTTAGLAAGRQQSALLLTAFAGLAAFVVVRCRGLGVSRMLAGTADALRQVGDLARHPGRLIAAAVASTASSVAIASGFVVAVHVWGSSSSPLPAGALLAVYLIGSAAGGTAPVPAFFGLTEAALVAGLVFGGYTFASAVLAVAMFRVLTYWMPLPAGLWAARRLRRANLI